MKKHPAMQRFENEMGGGMHLFTKKSEHKIMKSGLFFFQEEWTKRETRSTKFGLEKVKIAKFSKLETRKLFTTKCTQNNS